MKNVINISDIAISIIIAAYPSVLFWGLHDKLVTHQVMMSNKWVMIIGGEWGFFVVLYILYTYYREFVYPFAPTLTQRCTEYARNLRYGRNN